MEPSPQKTLSEVTRLKLREIKAKLRRFDSQSNSLKEVGEEEEFPPLPGSEEDLENQRRKNRRKRMLNWDHEVEMELREELRGLIRQGMNQEETDQAVNLALAKLRELSKEMVQGVQEEDQKQIVELESQLKFESELRALTESYQKELETMVEINRQNPPAKPAPAPASVEGTSSKSGNRSRSTSLSLFNRTSELEARIRQLEAQNESLTTELLDLQEKYTAMVHSRATIFFEKERLGLELENLTQELFEEANTMVANESRLRAELDASNQKLSRELQGALEALLTSANAQKEKYRMVQRRQSMTSDILLNVPPRAPNPQHLDTPTRSLHATRSQEFLLLSPTERQPPPLPINPSANEQETSPATPTTGTAPNNVDSVPS